MAMKPKKAISSRGESGVGAGSGRGSSGGGGGLTGSKKVTPKATSKPNMNKPCKTCGMVHANPNFKHDPKMEKFKNDLNAFLNFHSK